jgi:hypothetical protein
MANVTLPLEMSYSALLRRQDGVLRIRMEDESADPRSMPRPPVVDSGGGR